MFGEIDDEESQFEYYIKDEYEQGKKLIILYELAGYLDC